MSVQQARTLRAMPNTAERALWRILRHGELAALNWRKQSPFRQYVLDFVSHPARLVVEADGARHSLTSQKAHDQVRSALLEREGYKVIRLWNDEILSNGDSVFRTLLSVALESPARNRLLRWRDLHPTSPSMGEVTARSAVGEGEAETLQDRTALAPTGNFGPNAAPSPLPAALRPPSPSRGG
jgi:very-short-patch-repair endonuclease